MPKLFEYLGIIILFYSNEHEPVHVHGKHQSYESKAEIIIEEGEIIGIRLKDVIGKNPLRAKELKEFQNFVDKFKEEIVRKWIDYFVYHKSLKCVKIEGKVK